MDRHRLQAVWSLAEACYAQGQSLQAFLLLYSLLHDGCEPAERTEENNNTRRRKTSAAQPAFPAYLKRDEVATRVRAVEFLLYEPHASSPSSCASVPLGRTAQLEALTLAQELLDPLFAHTATLTTPSSSSSLLLLGMEECAATQDTRTRLDGGSADVYGGSGCQKGTSRGSQRRRGERLRMTSNGASAGQMSAARLSSLLASRANDGSAGTSYAGNEYYFSAANVQGVVWQASAFALSLPSSMMVTTATIIDPTTNDTAGGATTTTAAAMITIEVREASACATIPVALLLRAYVLRAMVCLRRNQHRRALGFLRAAERWLLSALTEPQLSGTVRDLCEELRGRVVQRNEDADNDRKEAAFAAAMLVLPEALHAVLSYEKVYCEGWLAAAFCHVLHGWLGGSHVLPSAGMAHTPYSHHTNTSTRTNDEGCTSNVCHAVSAGGHGMSHAQRQREYGEVIHLLGAYAAVYVSLSKATTPAQLRQSLTRLEETTSTNVTRGRDGPLRARLTRLVLQRIHSACLTSQPGAPSETAQVAGFPLRAVAALLGFYHCVAGVYLLHHRPRIAEQEQQQQQQEGGVNALLQQQHPALPLRRHLARCVGLFAGDAGDESESEWTLLERIYLLGPCEELAELRPALLKQLHEECIARGNDEEEEKQCEVRVLASCDNNNDLARNETHIARKRARDTSSSSFVSESCSALVPPCWTSAGLRRALSSLLLLWATTHGVAETNVTHGDPMPPLQAQVRRMSDRLMREVDAEMLRLAGPHTPAVTDDMKGGTKAAKREVKTEEGVCNEGEGEKGEEGEGKDDDVSMSQVFAWHASAAAQTRLLVQVKAAGLFITSSFALTQLQLVQAVRSAYELQQFMLLFRPRVDVWRTELHLLSACLAMSLSLREGAGLSCEATLLPHGAQSTNHHHYSTYCNRDDDDDDGDDEILWQDVGRDVGLPYAHLHAAEMGALYSLRSSPATLLLVRLLKALALYQVVAVGESVELVQPSSPLSAAAPPTTASAAGVSPRMNAARASSRSLAAHRIARLESVTSVSAPSPAQLSATTLVARVGGGGRSGNGRLVSPRKQRTYKSSALQPQLPQQLLLPPACTTHGAQSEASAATAAAAAEATVVVKGTSPDMQAKAEASTGAAAAAEAIELPACEQDKTVREEYYVVHAMALSQRHRCAAALQLLMHELQESYARYTALHEEQQQQQQQQVYNNEGTDSVRCGRQETRPADCTLLTSWSASNVVLFELLQGLLALSEDKDRQAAVQYFKTATHTAKQRLGTLHPFVADGLQWLASAAAAGRDDDVCREKYCSTKDVHAEDTTHDAARIALVAMHVALHANCTALWRLPAYHGRYEEDKTTIDERDAGRQSAPIDGHAQTREEQTEKTRIDHAADSLALPASTLDVRRVWQAELSQLAASPAQLLALAGMLPGTPAYARLGV